MYTQRQEISILQQRPVSFSVRSRACSRSPTSRRGRFFGGLVSGPQGLDGDAGHKVQHVAHEGLDVGRQHALPGSKGAVRGCGGAHTSGWRLRMHEVESFSSGQSTRVDTRERKTCLIHRLKNETKQTHSSAQRCALLPIEKAHCQLCHQRPPERKQ